MKTRKWLFSTIVTVVIIVALLVMTLILSAVLPKEQPMGIEFSNSSAQEVDFGNTPATDLSQKTLVIWFDLDSFGDTSKNAYLIKKRLWYSYIGPSTEKIWFIYGFGVGGETSGIWGTPNNSLGIGKNLVIIKYDNALVTNDPVILINNVQQLVTEVATPSGSVQTDAGFPLKIGGYKPSYKSIDGKIMQVLIYNRLLSENEASDIYNSRGASYPKNGLVYCPVFYGAAGLQTFDGATLAEANTLVDPCSGAVGVPYGNPVGVGEQYLSIR